MRKLSDIELFLLDMDGTFYLGEVLLPGAVEFLQLCKERGVRYTFLTNNSSKSSRDYIAKLARLGVEVGEQEMFTSGDATRMYMQQNDFPQEILLIGTDSLKRDFEAAGYCVNAAVPKAVVLGFDTEIDYARLSALCNAVRAGLPYIATHPDFNCPVENGYVPDVGSFIALVQASTGRLPDAVIGKPNAAIANSAALRAGLQVEQLCMVGDRMYTDIALGQAGVCTALVLSGETSRQSMQDSPFTPDFVFENLAEMAQALRRE